MRLVCGEETIDIELRDGGEAARVTSPGRRSKCRWSRRAGRVRLSPGDRHETFHCVRDGDACTSSGARAYRLEEETEGARRRIAMPGEGWKRPCRARSSP